MLCMGIVRESDADLTPRQRPPVLPKRECECPWCAAGPRRPNRMLVNPGPDVKPKGRGGYRLVGW